MALIRCPECEHQVSDRAIACPQCGRPVSTFAEAKVEAPAPRRERVTRPTAPDSALRSVDPSVVARETQLQTTGASDGATLECAECGEDVTHDIFRTQSERGYLCAECQDDVLDRAWKAQQRLQKWTRTIFLVFVVTTLLFGVMALTMTSTPQKTNTVRKR